MNTISVYVQYVILYLRTAEYSYDIRKEHFFVWLLSHFEVASRTFRTRVRTHD